MSFYDKSWLPWSVSLVQSISEWLSMWQTVNHKWSKAKAMTLLYVIIV